MLSGSCKLVWIISPGIKRPISARQTVDPAEKARYEPSTLFVRVSVPVYRVGRVNIGTHV